MRVTPLGALDGGGMIEKLSLVSTLVDIDGNSYIDTRQCIVRGMSTTSSPQTCCALGTGSLTDTEATGYAAMFKVLAEPVRLRILAELAAAGCGPISVNELTTLMGLSQPTISHHLKRMTEAGLLERSQEGRHVYHQVQPAPFAQLRTVLQIG